MDGVLGQVDDMAGEKNHISKDKESNLVQLSKVPRAAIATSVIISLSKQALTITQRRQMTFNRNRLFLSS